MVLPKTSAGYDDLVYNMEFSRYPAYYGTNHLLNAALHRELARRIKQETGHEVTFDDSIEHVPKRCITVQKIDDLVQLAISIKGVWRIDIAKDPLLRFVSKM